MQGNDHLMLTGHPFTHCVFPPRPFFFFFLNSMVTDPALVVLCITKTDILLRADKYNAAMKCRSITSQNTSYFLSFNMCRPGESLIRQGDSLWGTFRSDGSPL